MPDQPNETHTPGEIAYCGPYEEGAYLDGGCLITTAYNTHEPEPEIGIYDTREPLHTRSRGFSESDARHIVNCWNSYDKHFGPSAVSAAEGDKLGDLMRLAEFVAKHAPKAILATPTGDVCDTLTDFAILANKAISTPHAATRQEQTDER